MPSTSDNNKRIAKNTLMLYFRMILLMLISLYTSRVVLATLGETDYGLYSVVGGVVMMLAFLNGAMAGGTQRFLNTEMGKGSEEGLRRVFSSAVCIHILVALVVLLLAETLGLWFLNTHMTIPADRMKAANWVYQFSVAAFMVNILCVPYNASIIAHEKMSAFAYISILEAALKLLIVFLIQVLPSDKLISYAFLLFLVGIIQRIVYNVYCHRHFPETHFQRANVDVPLAKQMMAFSSWSIFGSFGYIAHTQGIAICVNLFFTPAVNAAQGLSNTINHAVTGFVANFQTALNPQIVQNYAAGRLSDMHRLIFRGCRLSFFLITLFAVPLIVEMPAVLGVWLKEVPEYTTIFARLVLAISVVNSYSGVLATSQGATGKVKVYQTTLTLTGFFHVPLTLVAFYYGGAPYVCSWIYIVIVLILQVMRIGFVSRSTHMPLQGFLLQVVLKCLLVLALAFIPALALHWAWRTGDQILPLLCKLAIAFLCTALIAFTLGLEKKEKQIILQTAKKKLLRYDKR